MTETGKTNDKSPEGQKNSENIVGLTNVKENVYSREGIIHVGESNSDYTYSLGTSENEACVLQDRESSFEEDPDVLNTVSNPLYAAWWDYLKSNRGKKKKRKLLEIYRDENYWADDKFSEDEFDYATI